MGPKDLSYRIFDREHPVGSIMLRPFEFLVASNPTYDGMMKRSFENSSCLLQQKGFKLIENHFIMVLLFLI